MNGFPVEFRHTGEVVQAPIPVTYQVIPYEENTWSSELPAGTICMYKNVDSPSYLDPRALIRPMANLTKHIHQYVYLLGVVHVNGILASQFIRYFNQLVLDYPGKNMDDIDVDEVFRGIRTEWHMAGMLVTPPVNVRKRESVNLLNEREVVCYIQGQFPCENLWGPKLKGPNYCFLVLKMLLAHSTKPTVTLSGNKYSRPSEPFLPNPNNSGYLYYPAIVAVIHDGPVLPLAKRKFSMIRSDATLVHHFGDVLWVGMCMNNPKNMSGPTYEPTSETILNNALASRANGDITMLFTGGF